MLSFKDGNTTLTLDTKDGIFLDLETDEGYESQYAIFQLEPEQAEALANALLAGAKAQKES